MNRKKMLVIVPFAILLFSCCIAFATETSDSFFTPLIDCVKWLFVPSENFFHNHMQQLSELFYSKVSVFTYLYKILRNFFEGLGTVHATGLIFTLPDNFYFHGFSGMSVNLFSSAGYYIKLLRDVLNCCCFLLTAVVLFKYISKLFSE